MYRAGARSFNQFNNSCAQFLSDEEETINIVAINKSLITKLANKMKVTIFKFLFRHNYILTTQPIDF